MSGVALAVYSSVCESSNISHDTMALPSREGEAGPTAIFIGRVNRRILRQCGEKPAEYFMQSIVLRSWPKIFSVSTGFDAGFQR